MKDNEALPEGGQSIPLILKALRIQLEAGGPHDPIRERLAELLLIINHLPEEPARAEYLRQYNILLDNLKEK